jgi:hypothetical protein
MTFIMNRVMVLDMGLKMDMNMSMVEDIDLDTNKEGPLDTEESKRPKRIEANLRFALSRSEYFQANRSELK